ncbi:GxxExxY protein [bacterium]|nr:GxxExxY protein [bacterium]
MALLHEDLTNKILGCFYRAYNELGYGFYNKVCANAVRIELTETGLTSISDLPVTAYYHGLPIGNFLAHLCVEKKVIVMVEADEHICPAHEAKLLNYLKATDFEVGLLLNFGPKPSFIRKAYENKNKKGRQEIETAAVTEAND